MAKKPTEAKEPEEKSALPAVKEEAGLPGNPVINFEEDAGAGSEDVTMRDQVIPFFRIIQSLSPQRRKSEPEKYIPGAEEGMFFNTATKQLMDGQKGIYVVMVDFARRYAEWKPRNKGGGLVADYGADETCYEKRKAQPNEKGKYITPDGNEIVLSGNHFCLQIDPETGEIVDRGVFSLSSTYHKKSKEWNTLVKNIKLKNSRGQYFNPASFYMVYKLTTVLQSNEQGEWYNYNVEYYKPVTELPGGGDLYLAAKKFHEDIRSGVVHAAVDEDQSGSSDEDMPF